MTVEELIAKLGFKVTGQAEAKKFIKTLADIEKAVKTLGKGFKVNLTSNTSGLGRMTKDFEKATAAAKRFRMEIDRTNRVSVRGGRGPGGRGFDSRGYGFDGYRPGVGRGRGRAPGRTGRNRRPGGEIDPVLDAGLAGAGMGLGRTGTVAAAAYLGGSAVASTTKKAMTWERAMIDVAKATNSSGKELEAYADKIQEISRATGKDKEGLAGILAAAGFAGRPEKDLARFTEYGAKASVAWRMTPEAAGEGLAQLGNIYQTDQPGLETLGDQINTMADKTAASEKDLLEVLRRVGGTGKEAGLTSGQVLASGATLLERGVQPEVTASGLEAYINFLKLGEEYSSKADEGLKALGMTSDKLRKDFVKSPFETFVGFLDKLNSVSDKMKKSEIMTQIFGKERQDDVSRLAQSTDKLKANAAIMGDPKQYAGSVAGQFDDQMKLEVSRIDQATQILDQFATSAGDYGKSALAAASDLVKGAYGVLTKKSVEQSPNDIENRARVAAGLPELFHGDFEGRFGASPPSAARNTFRGTPVLTRQPKGMPTIGYPTAGGSTAPSFGAGTFGLNGAGGKGASWMNQGAKETVTNNTTNNTDVGNDKRTQTATVTVNATGLNEVGALVKQHVQAGLAGMGPSIVKANSIPTAGGTASSPSP